MKPPEQLIDRVENRVIETYQLAENIYHRTFELPSIDWDLSGHCAGKAYLIENRIRLNSTLLIQNADDFIRQTVPHEIAHLLNHAMNGRSVRPHGPEWQSIMRNLGLPPRRRHNYPVAVQWRRPRPRHSLYCMCREHFVTQAVLNRMSVGRVYICRQCHSYLQSFPYFGHAVNLGATLCDED